MIGRPVCLGRGEEGNFVDGESEEKGVRGVGFTRDCRVPEDLQGWSRSGEWELNKQL